MTIPQGFEKFGEILVAGMKLKKVMQRRQITAARAKCPFCENGFLHGRLAGRKSHMHMACDGCDVRMME
jgi:hypothetical protein